MNGVDHRKQVLPAGQLVFVRPVGLPEQALGPVARDRALKPPLDPDAEPAGPAPAWEDAERQQRASSPGAPTTDRQELRGVAKPFTPPQFVETFLCRHSDSLPWSDRHGVHRPARQIGAGFTCSKGGPSTLLRAILSEA